MDGGCEYNGYASDLTRTWPVSGKFTRSQKEIYQMVLDVQKICLLVRQVFIFVLSYVLFFLFFVECPILPYFYICPKHV